jgi:hypothetical protein
MDAKREKKNTVHARYLAHHTSKTTVNRESEAKRKEREQKKKNPKIPIQPHFLS